MTDFGNFSVIKKTRKDHHCQCCDKAIVAGSADVVHWAGKWDGEFASVHYHSECRAAEIAWNNEFDLWGDDFWNLYLLAQEEEFSSYLLTVREKWPAVADRLAA